MYVGVPMGVYSEKISEERRKEFETWMSSCRLEDLLKAADFEELTLRQAMYLAHRSIDMADADASLLAELAKKLLRPEYAGRVAPILEESPSLYVWLELAEADGVPRDVLERIFERTTKWRRSEPMILEIWEALASSAVLPGEIQDQLLNKNNWKIRKKLAYSPTMSGRRLLKLAKAYRDGWQDDIELIKRVGEHPNATDETVGIAKKILQYYHWTAETKKLDLDPCRLVELARECAKIEDCPMRAIELAQGIIAHPYLEPEALEELAESPYGYIWYLVARCEVTSTETLEKLLRNVFAERWYKRDDTQFRGILREIVQHPSCNAEVIDTLLEEGEGTSGWWVACFYASYSRHTTSEQLNRMINWKDGNNIGNCRLARSIVKNPKASKALIKACIEFADSGVPTQGEASGLRYICNNRSAADWETERSRELALHCAPEGVNPRG